MSAARYSPPTPPDTDTAKPHRTLTLADYRTLADFRHYLRRFLAFSEELTAAAGMPASQYQALLAIQALTDSGTVTTTTLADRLCLKLNSVVELIDRLVMAELVQRSRAAHDRRSAVLALTSSGVAALETLAAAHLSHHRAHLPELIETMTRLMVESHPTN